MNNGILTSYCVDQFYLVNAGYPCTGGFMPPYRGQRYHVQDYRGRGRGPRSRTELFNYVHSSMRMVIERCFGVLKSRFPILKLMPPYKPTRQRLLVVACCTIHNYIRKQAQRDILFQWWENADPTEMGESSSSAGSSSNANNPVDLSDASAAAMAAYRDHIANLMWAEHCNPST